MSEGAAVRVCVALAKDASVRFRAPGVHSLRASSVGASDLGTRVESQLVMSSLCPVSPLQEYDL